MKAELCTGLASTCEGNGHCGQVPTYQGSLDGESLDAPCNAGQVGKICTSWNDNSAIQHYWFCWVVTPRYPLQQLLNLPRTWELPKHKVFATGSVGWANCSS